MIAKLQHKTKGVVRYEFVDSNEFVSINHIQDFLSGKFPDFKLMSLY
jgi:hypothetical protein